VGGAVVAVMFIVGGFILGFSIFTITHGTFPSWWKGILLWPLVRVTPTIARLQGWSGVAIGGAIVLIGLAILISTLVAAVLFAAAVLAYIVGVALFMYSTRLSREPEAGIDAGGRRA
jgi:hypothetical protein